MNIIVALLTLLIAAVNAQTEWHYPSNNDEWASAGYPVCSSGQEQSPINLPSFDLASTQTDLMTLITWDEETVQLDVSSHGMKWAPPDGSTMGSSEVDGSVYDNVQFHMHTASEHTENGVQYDLEVHFVHMDGSGNLAVIGVMCNGADEGGNEFFTTLMNAGEDEVTLNPGNIFNGLDTTKYYQYDGSLTTPDCREGVEWKVIADACVVPNSFLTWVGGYSSMEGNFRDVQPLNHRTITGFEYGEWHYPADNQEWADAGYLECVSGQEQSPVDLPNFALATEQTDVLTLLTWKDEVLQLNVGGHGLKWAPPDGSTMGSSEVDGSAYDNVQFHMHTASEHTENGVQYDLEVHFVHMDGSGNLAVIGVMCNGADEGGNEFFTTLMNAGEDEVTLNPGNIFNGLDTTKYYQYDGSLTTPDCREGVEWKVIADACVVPNSFLNWLTGYDVMTGNYRDTQPLYGREITGWAPGSETTSEPENCDDYDTLLATIGDQEDQISNLQDDMADALALLDTLGMDVDTLDNDVNNLASCVSGDYEYEIQTTLGEPYVFVEADTVCIEENPPRTFNLNTPPSLEDCAYRCFNDILCEYFSYREGDIACIGCSDVPSFSLVDHAPGQFSSYQLTQYAYTLEDDRANRRNLKATELRRENSELRRKLTDLHVEM